MKILTAWLRDLLPGIPVDDRQLAEDLTLRGIAVEGEHAVAASGAMPAGTLFEMDITTNRVDAMNHYGVAREVATMYELRLPSLRDTVAAPIAAAPITAAADGAAADEAAWPVRIEADDLCGHFTARVVRGIRVGASTGIMADYFAALGQKPISAPVDATNVGWLLMGQPTHAFDLDKVQGGIVVRRARAGERLRLLDGVERVLVADDLVVADEVKALGLAGVMGGWDSRITDETTNVLVEAAWFLPAAVRASSRRHGLHTDASHRFERGADFAAAPLANDLVTRLIVAQCGGTVGGPMTVVTVPAQERVTAGRAPVVLRVARVQYVLGSTLEQQESEAAGKPESPLHAAMIRRTLEALGCRVVSATSGTAATSDTESSLKTEPMEFRFALPSWRLDLEREIDLVEEVARVYGYNRFANTLPAAARAVDELPHARAEAHLRATLRAAGYSESLGSTFASAAEAAMYGDASRGAVALGNPMNDEAGTLRPSLLPNIVRALAENGHRDTRSARLFELGTVFTGSAQTVDEAQSLAVGLMEATPAAGPLHAAADALFFELKGVVEALLAGFEGHVQFSASPLPGWVEPGRGAVAVLDGRRVAVLGELAAAERARLKLRFAAVAAEVDAASLLALPLRQPLARELSRFQAAERDFSFVFADAISWSRVEGAVQALAIDELRSLAPVEIFRDARGKAVPAGHHSLLLRAVLQADDRTLTEAELSAWSASIVAALTALGGVQRA